MIWNKDPIFGYFPGNWSFFASSNTVSLWYSSISFVFLMSNNSEKNVSNSSGIFVFNHDYFSSSASENLSWSLKSTCFSAVRIDLAALFIVSNERIVFIISAVETDDKETSNDWFFLSGVQNCMLLPSSSDRVDLICFLWIVIFSLSWISSLI